MFDDDPRSSNIFYKCSLKCSMKMFTFRYADYLTVGDEVLVTDNDKLIPTTVTNKSTFEMQGDHIFSK